MLVWGIIIAVLIAIGFVRFRISFRHDPAETRLTIRFGLLRFRVLPAKERKLKAKKPAKKEGKEPFLQNFTKDITSLGVRPLTELIIGLIKKSMRGVRFDRIEFDYIIGGQADPCKTAMDYGRWMTGVGAILPLLDEKLRIKRYHIDIAPDFTREKSEIRARLDVSTSVGRGIGIFIYALGKGIKLLKQSREIPAENKRRKAA